MTKRKVWRYRCDFCKKQGGSAGAMAKHEKHCTGNPCRVCRVCDSSVPIANMLLALKLTGGFASDPVEGCHDDRQAMDVTTLQQLKTAVDGCPACMLAVIRQSNRFPEAWDYKKEHDEYWAERNAEHMASISCHEDY